MSRSQAVFTGIKGRDGSTVAELEIPQHRCKEAMNVDWYQSAMGRKRNGMTALSMTGGTAFASAVYSVSRFVPGADETVAQLFAVDGSTPGAVKRLAGGVTWADVTVADNVASGAALLTTATLNGKHFFAYDSSVDRLHAWDPATSTIRRVGLQTPTAAPTSAASAGTVTDTRKYKVAWLTKSGSTILLRSELSAASNAQALATQLATVTRPTAPSEGETHWELYALSDDDSYAQEYLIATTAIGTTTATDDNATLSGDAPPTVGVNIVPTSVKHLLSDGNRLIMAGSHETGGKNNRVWFTPVLGSSDIGDDERVPNTTTQKNWIDLDENDGGFITGLGGPLQGAIWVFKYRQIWKLVPTGNVSAPYRPYAISKTIGCIATKSIVLGEDEAGNPALYFLSHKGPYRIGSQGLQFLGKDVQDYWDRLTLSTAIGPHGIYHADRHQVWWWIPVDGGSVPATKLVFDPYLGVPDTDGSIRNGWSVHDGPSATAICSVMYSNTVGATMSRDLKPYIGINGGGIYKADSTATDDAGTAFAAYVELPSKHLAGVHRRCQVFPSLVLGSAGSQTLRLTLTRDYGVEERTFDTTMTAAGSETRVLKQFEASGMTDALCVKAKIGDDTARSNAWNLDALILPNEALAEVTA